jgi:cytochrome c-type biogenesis protein CcmF
MMAKGGANSEALLEAGPAWYYNGLALVGLLVASLLFFNALFFFARAVKTPSRRAPAIGGGFAHVAMAIILIGLIGSSMYVYEESGYLKAGKDAGTTEPFTVQEYRLEYQGDSVTDNSATNNQVIYEVTFDVFKDDRYVGSVSPSVQLDVITQQQKINAGVLGFPEEDLFVVYRGVNQNGDYSLDVRVNQFISLVWIGFGMLMLGTLFALVGRRKTKASSR